jgi:hypothetical protein
VVYPCVCLYIIVRTFCLFIYQIFPRYGTLNLLHTDLIPRHIGGQTGRGSIPDPGIQGLLPLHKHPRVRGFCTSPATGTSHAASGTSHRNEPLWQSSSSSPETSSTFTNFLPSFLASLSFLTQCRRGSMETGRMKALRKLHSRDRRGSSRTSSQSRLP